MDKLTEATGTLREGNYSTRVKVEGKDEITRLQNDFNEMAATLEKALSDLQAERDAVAGLLQSRRELFASVSHELRTPVATARAYTESFRRSAKRHPELQADLDILEREILRLQRMIDDVFVLARVEADQLQFEINAVEIGSVIERVVKAARVRAWQTKKVDVVLEYIPQLPLAMVDESRLEQIMYNLLRNAIRHTLPGGLVAVVITPKDEMLNIDVRDTGEGISPQDLPHIWERFYRSPGTRSADHDGAGLGLALVKEMTGAMNGTVAVETTPGEGTCFTIRLPRANPI